MNALDAVSGPLPTLKTAQTDAPEAVRKAAREFEGMVLGQLLKPMFDALDTSGLGGGGEGERMFRPMLIERYAQSLSERGGIGLSDSVVREMLRLQEGAR